MKRKEKASIRRQETRRMNQMNEEWKRRKKNCIYNNIKEKYFRIL